MELSRPSARGDVYHEYYLSPNTNDPGLSEWRTTRIANGRTLVLVVAVLTQVVVLALVAMIMGVAVLTMCAVLGELLVITAVATALERQVVTFSDLANLMEVSATLLVTVITIVLAFMGGGVSLDGATLTTAKFS